MLLYIYIYIFVCILRNRWKEEKPKKEQTGKATYFLFPYVVCSIDQYKKKGKLMGEK